ncbi:hypothetical protein [Hyphomicrobium sp.]|uniref:hypothetical protein n=1 Tax=Hyphomicrobium sp. TaxID=82 RepID=UPI0025BD6C61|nr:hypothetical protein [Hyphomicrobium sp.]MCC7251433.1 hypothetical protein [Hyphomicrobium sp.]
MTHRPSGRQQSRNSWSALLAVVLGALAGATSLGLNTSFAGGLSIAEHGRDVRTTGKPASVRPDTIDPSLNLGGLDDPSAALAAGDIDTGRWTGARITVLPAPFLLPLSIARTRDGRTRAPPHA